MNFNYKTAFFLSLGILIFSWILFAGYLILTLVTFMDAGKSNLITKHDCTDGDYCANNPKNMPAGGWTNDETNPPTHGMMEDKVNNGKVDASTLYQNVDFGFRFDLSKEETALPCEWDSEGHARIAVYLAKGTGFDMDKVCDYSGTNQYIFVTSDKDTSAIESIKKVTDTKKFKTEPYEVSSITGTRYTSDDGDDFTVLYANGRMYEITSDFYDRNVYIW